MFNEDSSMQIMFTSLDMKIAFTQHEVKSKQLNKHVQKQVRIEEYTLLLSSISALFPTKILVTLSEACCSMFRIQFLMSATVKNNENNQLKHHIERACKAQKYILLNDDSSVTS
jgi:hypothetical protein